MYRFCKTLVFVSLLLVCTATFAQNQVATATPTPGVAVAEDPTFRVSCTPPRAAIQVLKYVAKSALKDSGVTRGSVKIRINRQPSKEVKLSELGQNILYFDPVTFKYTKTTESVLGTNCKEYSATISARGVYQGKRVPTTVSEITIMP